MRTALLPEARPAEPAAVLAARIVDAVWQAVADGRLPAGTRLREEALAAIFRASRGAVRDALRSLAEREVVVLSPNRGAAVANPTPEDAEEAYRARALIEGAMAAELAQNITAADLRRLREHVARQMEAEAAGDRREYLRLMGDFHRVLARLHGNRVLAATLDRIIARTSLMTALYPPEKASCAIDDHVALIEGLAAGDAEAARRIAAGHLLENLRRLRPRPPAPPVDLQAALLPEDPPAAP